MHHFVIVIASLFLVVQFSAALPFSRTTSRLTLDTSHSQATPAAYRDTLKRADRSSFSPALIKSLQFGNAGITGFRGAPPPVPLLERATLDMDNAKSGIVRKPSESAVAENDVVPPPGYVSRRSESLGLDPGFLASLRFGTGVSLIGSSSLLSSQTAA